MNLAIFDLDHTILPIDSDHEWGEFLSRTGAVDGEALRRANDEWFAQYQAGTLDPVKYLEFAFEILSRFPRDQLDAWHQQYMEEVIKPAMVPAAQALVQQHLDAGDLVAIVTATNSFVTGPIGKLFKVHHLIGAEPEIDASGRITGRLIGTPTFGPGKVTHTEAWLKSLGKTIEDFPKSYFYSDSQNDIPLLERVTHPVATNPNDKLKAHAIAKGWPILNVFDAHAQ
jgi:HAD superfamily hydrolase (TIGR01490 family)